jgi:predicted RNA-binding Zn ribbon-like protein
LKLTLKAHIMGTVRDKLLRLAGTKPAPDDLILVQAFINSADLDAGTDRLATASGLHGWFRDLDLIETSARVNEADVVAAKAVREALRDLVLANTGDGAADRNALETLNRAARSAQLSARFEPGGRAVLESRAPGIDGAIGKILALTFDAMESGQWPRLKACPADNCRWAFFDETKNRSGTWCAMSVCGNRAKARSFRKRHVTADHAH